MALIPVRGLGASLRGRGHSLHLYLALVFAAGACALCLDMADAQVPAMAGNQAIVTIALAIALVIGELFPLQLRRGYKFETYTLSGTATIALVITGPLWVVALAQISAGLVDDIRSGRPFLKRAFNVSQYAIGLTASRAVYAFLVGRPFNGYTPDLRPQGLLPALVAAFVFFLVNMTLVAMVGALADRRRAFSYVPTYFRGELTTAMTLLAVGPIVLTALNFSVFTMPLCLLPVLAVSGTLKAANREVQAMHDSLTGLPNRALLLERAERALDDRGAGMVALLFVDLDHFKQVNDAMGHPVGDDLLREIGGRLASVIRGDDFAARLGGDEFAVLCHDVPDATTAIELAARISRSLAGPVLLQGVGLHVEASIGIALVPVHADEVDTLLRRADIALYQAKATGPGSIVMYDSSYDNNSVERLSLMAQLKSGLDHELVVHYQPKCRLSDGRIVGVEALVRWQHPTLGLLPPDRFLSAAENTGLMLPLTLQVTRQTLAQWERWHESGLDLTVSVNVSARNLQADLPTHMAALLDEYTTPPGSLILEVTESAVINDTDEAARVIQQLLAMGIGISIDDFGTGHASLAYIKELSPSEVKIDRSFVSCSADSARDAALIRAAVELGRSLGMQVVAEGVETPEALRILSAVGCDLVQGFLMLPPVPGDELATWVGQPHTWPAHLFSSATPDAIALEGSVR